MVHRVLHETTPLDPSQERQYVGTCPVPDGTGCHPRVRSGCDSESHSVLELHLGEASDSADSLVSSSAQDLPPVFLPRLGWVPRSLLEHRPL